jgi:heparin/heparan-sulfate lyase
MILIDDLTTSNPAFEKLWQLTTFKAPRPAADGVELWSDVGGTTGRLHVSLLEPRLDARRLEIVSGPDVCRVGGQVFSPPAPDAPEAKGHRIVVSSVTVRAHERFTALLQATDAEPLPYTFEETDALAIIRIADRVVVISKQPVGLARPFEFTTPETAEPVSVVLLGLQPGTWRINGETTVIAAGKNATWLKSRGGQIRAAPAD